MKGIDVSRWQGVIDWGKVKASGIDFAILKCGGSDAGCYTDRTFEYNYANAKAHGIKLGAYYFVGVDCVNYKAGVETAKRMLAICNGKDFELPLFIDCESQAPVYKSGITDSVLGFYNCMRENGRSAGVYASAVSGFKDRIDDSKIKHIPHWVAQYRDTLGYKGEWMIWQKSSKGKVPGINGNVDIDEMKGVVKTVKATDVQVVCEVIVGNWGVGTDREKRLTEAGYNAADVQKHVNAVYALFKKGV